MPSSDINMVPIVLNTVLALNPKTILDIGCGNGRYGFLFRECMDWNHGRLNSYRWEIKIDYVEIEEDYLSPIHKYVYDLRFNQDWMDIPCPEEPYDLVFMGDVLEHWPDGEWEKALLKAKKVSKITLVVSPHWDGSINQGAWHGYENETHRTVLSPAEVGGKLLYASPKMFMCGFDNRNTGVFNKI